MLQTGQAAVFHCPHKTNNCIVFRSILFPRPLTGFFASLFVRGRRTCRVNYILLLKWELYFSLAILCTFTAINSKPGNLCVKLEDSQKCGITALDNMTFAINTCVDTFQEALLAQITQKTVLRSSNSKSEVCVVRVGTNTRKLWNNHEWHLVV